MRQVQEQAWAIAQVITFSGTAVGSSASIFTLFTLIINNFRWMGERARREREKIKILFSVFSRFSYFFNMEIYSWTFFSVWERRYGFLKGAVNKSRRQTELLLVFSTRNLKVKCKIKWNSITLSAHAGKKAPADHKSRHASNIIYRFLWDKFFPPFFITKLESYGFVRTLRLVRSAVPARQAAAGLFASSSAFSSSF